MSGPSRRPDGPTIAKGSRIAKRPRVAKRSLAVALFAGAAGCASGSGSVSLPTSAPDTGPVPLPIEALPPYAVYTGEGEPATLDDVVAAMGEVDVVLVGEEHDDPVGHAVEVELLERAYRRWGDARTVVLSLEMFETDVQLVVDEYVRGLISEEHFLASARPWTDYDVRYRPMMEFAKAHVLPVVAANAPRRYVNMVSRGGRGALSRLSDEARSWLPPLPYPQPSEVYRAQWDSVMARAAAQASENARHASAPPESVFQAQALWDATMAWSVARALDEHGRALVLHFVGGFHVERGTGMPEALAHYAPAASSLVVAMRSTRDPRVFAADDRGRGDFVVLTRAER